jgi:hypothetical protein
VYLALEARNSAKEMHRISHIPVAVRYKAYVCGRLIAGIPGSNPGEGIVRLYCLLCVVSVAVCATS